MSNHTTDAQAGVLAGRNPLAFNSANPLPLFIIQVTVIIGFCRLLSIPLARIRQPTVIAEVLGGIILGPSVMGRIPNFQATIFPPSSLPFINLTANLGLVLFLFLVGLEIDPKMIKQGARRSLSIAVCGMVLPFALGVAVSYLLYNFDGDKNIPFGSFLLFLGVAMSITAFPVLARILAELKLLKTEVGAITMSAGLLNDCTAWVLLALVVALINSTSSLTALWVFFCAVGWGLLIIFIVGPLFKRLCIITGSFENGPPPIVMAVLLMMVLLSAFITDMIGVHAIFGGFLVGVIVPHEGGFAVKVTEKIEDLVHIVLLPLYFALSGLKTQIGLLDSGEVWGFVILTIAVACFGKVVGCAGAARLSGMTMRESLTVGFLMNCKGLVELIVLNLGHDAGVINDTVFVIMVVMALVTTCMTSPIVIWLYPVSYQRQRELELQQNPGLFRSTRQIDVESTDRSFEKQPDTDVFRLMVSLNNVQHIPSVMALIQMLRHEPKPVSDFSSEKPSTFPLEIHALRLIELTQRTSAVMMMQESQNTINRDSVVSVIRTFARLNHIGIKAHLAVSAAEDFAKNLTEQAAATNADMIVLPWDDPISYQEGLNPLEPWLMQKDTGIYNPHHTQFVLKVFTGAICPVGLFFDRGFGVGQTDMTSKDNLANAAVHHPAGTTEQHILVPFFGGIDDREAVNFALKLSSYPGVSVTVLRLVVRDNNNKIEEVSTPVAESLALAQTPNSHRPTLETRTSSNRQEVATPTLTMTSSEVDRLNSQVADNALIHLLWQQSAEAQSLVQETDLTEQQQTDYFGSSAIIPTSKKVHFAELSTAHPLQDVISYARQHLTKKDLLIVGRRKVGGLWSFKEEITRIFEKQVEPADQENEAPPKTSSRHQHSGQGEMRKVLGDVAQGVWVGGVTASLLVVQAKLESKSRQ